ncbi:sporulation-specific diadenylate cyclase CdaS [Paenibacillus sepulcri]|uniref:Diadenylate cyclase n=1 Tax=Paenibacillus sepulcri TaxID=359917 RepID=A0ABS7C050_9BACL|nr:sporulation-specific diadenylate cyclase CdaS [Paenibacillus sepulcri]
MGQGNCDETPLKERLKQHIHLIVNESQRILDQIDAENHCLLSDFDNIGRTFKEVESLAASFYLQCYLSSFTSNYLDLSICIQNLMERRHGALIVIERNDNLDAIIHSGVALVAKLSYSLLEAIFYPGNPLHDGAVLIKSDQIISAANVLPVSNASNVDKKFGMRHRAAIGLTEITDALVLVVSEESGDASFVYKGKLHPIKTMVMPTTV